MDQVDDSKCRSFLHLVSGDLATAVGDSAHLIDIIHMENIGFPGNR
jgi:hypothetical protein